jgi:hypothetical protein
MASLYDFAIQVKEDDREDGYEAKAVNFWNPARTACDPA